MKTQIMKATQSLFLGAAILGAFPAHAADALWRIKKDQWSETDEKKYSEFVQELGESGCNSADKCLKSAANPYRATDPAGVTFRSDCADFPYFLRSYFAWKNGLPFSYQSEMAVADGVGGDIRYSKNGNRVSGRTDVIAKGPGKFPNAIKVMPIVSDTISSAMFRYNPASDDAVKFTDMYSTKISRESIHPGTVIYDVAGHVAVVYKVENDGRIKYIDAHPDNSVTHGTYGEHFARSRPAHGAGFKNWRPIKLVGASKDSEGNLIGGKVVAKRNSEIADYSVEQFYGTHPDPKGSWSAGTFSFNGQNLAYYDFVRHALAIGNLKYDPMDELKNMLQAICQSMHDRIDAVQTATDKGIASKAHPSKLPNNIYGTDGEWEEYSTPSRDARLKTSFREARTRTEEFVQLFNARSPQIAYSGVNLKADLLKVYRVEAQACQIQYKKSDGSLKTMNLDQVQKRIFALSFDPYHCIERRWGETDPQELRTCGDDKNKQQWYAGEQFMRNQIDRTYDDRMDFELNQIFTPQKGNGVTSQPDLDILRFLSS